MNTLNLKREIKFGGVMAMLVLFPVLTFPGCGDDDDTLRPSQPGSAGVTVSIPEGAMNLGDDAFGENPLVVSRGTTVTWTNNDTMAHTVTSDESSDETFDSGELQPGESFSHQFNTEGSFEYFCQTHPSMRGEVEVTLDGANPSPTPSPSVSATPTPGPTFTILPVPTPLPTNQT